MPKDTSPGPLQSGGSGPDLGNGIFAIMDCPQMNVRSKLTLLLSVPLKYCNTCPWDRSIFNVWQFISKPLVPFIHLHIPINWYWQIQINHHTRGKGGILVTFWNSWVTADSVPPTLASQCPNTDLMKIKKSYQKHSAYWAVAWLSLSSFDATRSKTMLSIT